VRAGRGLKVSSHGLVQGRAAAWPSSGGATNLSRDISISRRRGVVRRGQTADCLHAGDRGGRPHLDDAFGRALYAELPVALPVGRYALERARWRIDRPNTRWMAARSHRSTAGRLRIDGGWGTGRLDVASWDASMPEPVVVLAVLMPRRPLRRSAARLARCGRWRDAWNRRRRYVQPLVVGD